jgi:hypothetical protein
MGQAVIFATEDQAFLDSLKAAGHTTSFTLTMTYPNPIVTIEVVGSTAADTVTTTQMVLKRFEDTARSLQKAYGVKDQDLITTQRLDQSDNVKPAGGKVKRAIIAVAAVGMMVTCGVTILVDAISRRRARRRREQEDKINPLAIELALAHPDALPAPTNGHAADQLPKIPATRLESVVPKASDPGVTQVMRLPTQKSAAQIVEPVPTAEPGESPGTRDAPAEPLESPVSQLGLPVTGKPPRVLKAGTYRSINAAGNGADHEADPAHVPADVQSPAVSVPPDVTIVLPPKWTAGENGKRH